MIFQKINTSRGYTVLTVGILSHISKICMSSICPRENGYTTEPGIASTIFVLSCCLILLHSNISRLGEQFLSPTYPLVRYGLEAYITCFCTNAAVALIWQHLQYFLHNALLRWQYHAIRAKPYSFFGFYKKHIAALTTFLTTDRGFNYFRIAISIAILCCVVYSIREEKPQLIQNVREDESIELEDCIPHKRVCFQDTDEPIRHIVDVT